MRNVVDQSSGHRDPAKLIRVTPCTAPSRAGLLSPLPVPTETLWAALHIRPLVSFWGGRSAKGRAVSILTLPDSHPSLSPSGAQRAQDADSLPGRQVPRAGCLISAPTAKALNEPQAAPPYGAPNPDTHLNISDRPHTAPRVPAPQHTPCPLPQGPSGTWVTRGVQHLQTFRGDAARLPGESELGQPCAPRAWPQHAPPRAHQLTGSLSSLWPYLTRPSCLPQPQGASLHL